MEQVAIEFDPNTAFPMAIAAADSSSSPKSTQRDWLDRQLSESSASPDPHSPTRRLSRSKSSRAALRASLTIKSGAKSPCYTAFASGKSELSSPTKAIGRQSVCLSLDGSPKPPSSACTA